MNKIRIAGAIASNTGITLYLENGGELNLPKDSWRTKAILDEVLKPLARHKIVEIDLDAFSVEARIEKKSGGLIRFLKETVATIGQAIGLAKVSVDGVDIARAPAVRRETTVAIVNNVRIPGVEALEKQMEQAAYTGNTIGLQRFLERIATVIGERGHTVDELLNFMKRADLPIADDGSIIAYKVLTTVRGEKDVFVDCHSKKVRQRFGSRVSMDISLVDPNRRQECSTGLHVARRGYLRGFSGDTITMIKIAPEDVIAVPYNEPNKMRVAAYHIVAVLPENVHSILRADKPMTTDPIAAAMLADIVAGSHIGVIEEVVIGSAMGGDLKIAPVGNAMPAPTPFQNGHAKALDERNLGVTVREIQDAVKEAVDEAVETAAERRNRVKREKRAAASLTKVVSKSEKVVETPPAPPAKKAKKATPIATGHLDSYARALALVSEGKLSMRAIERETGVSARTIGRLLQNK